MASRVSFRQRYHLSRKTHTPHAQTVHLPNFLCSADHVPQRGGGRVLRSPVYAHLQLATYIPSFTPVPGCPGP